jgi:hypothetical protein
MVVSALLAPDRAQPRMATGFPTPTRGGEGMPTGVRARPPPSGAAAATPPAGATKEELTAEQRENFRSLLSNDFPEFLREVDSPNSS